jgi:aspartyl/asparaginyl beta-hydroxylase (cupin superfamily)
MEEHYLRWLLAVLKRSLTKMLKAYKMKTMDRLRIMMKSLRKIMASIPVLLSRALLFRFPTTPERGSGESNVNDYRSELF